MPLKFIKSTKDEKQLYEDGYLYNFKSENKDSFTWRCVSYHSSLHCPGIVHTDTQRTTGNVIGIPPTHNHASDASNIGVKIVISKIKKRAAKSDDVPSAVVGSALAAVSSPIVARLPKMSSLNRDVQRARKVNEVKIPTSESRKDLVIPHELTMTAKGDKMLLPDSGGNRSRFIIIATAKKLTTLGECQEWAGDGTFSSVPSIFKQLYTIHGLVKGKLLPLVYVLMPNKNENTYSNVLYVLKNNLPINNLNRMMVDFEPAFLNAFRLCFHDVEIAGCLFHFSQCIWRQLQSLGLQKSYNKDVRFALNVKMLMAIAFVPTHDVIEAFEDLVRSPYYEENEVVLEPLVNYFERTWIGVPSRSGKRRLKQFFSINLWNCYEAVLGGLMRTNNALEGWHNSFNRKVRINHATMSKYITVIKNEQTITETLLTQLNTGLSIAAKRKKVYADIDYRLNNIVSDYKSTNKLQYLHDIACVLSL